MNSLSSVIFSFCLMLGLAAHADNLRGYIITSDSQYFVSDTITQKTYSIQPASADVKTALGKLKNLDTFVGTGTINGNTVVLESIDFVALRRLIGIWKGSTSLVNFLDYSRVHFQMPGKENEYQYTISPAEGNNWRIFFTSHNSVMLGNLAVQNSKAQIEVYDSLTGEVTQRYDLQKLLY